MLLSHNKLNQNGWWKTNGVPPETGERALQTALLDVKHPIILVDDNGRVGVGKGGAVTLGEPAAPETEGYPLIAYAPPLPPENLGDPVFKQTYGLRYAYVAGAMANGITSEEMVAEMGRNGMIGFFGAAGLSVDEVESAIINLSEKLPRSPFGSNLIHSPNDPDLEEAVVNLYLKHGIRYISASAYLDLTLPLVYFRVKGIHRDRNGNIECPNKVVAKVSRIEVATKFFSPPPQKFLTRLVDAGMITRDEATLAMSVPMAEDLTAEADSGGHTDNRPAISLLPTMMALRDQLSQKYGYHRPPCVGLGGGISTPESAAAAFAMGAAYVLTGSVNQSCVEAGIAETVREMLAEARQADVIMAPSADMFEMGVKVQVLKRGTMFPLRAAKLYELYCAYDCYEDIPEKQKAMLERDYFRTSYEECWANTKAFFSRCDPAQIAKAEKNPKHKMALVFRSYLGLSSKWAKSGDPDRKIDYQIWCGPSLGAFNEWAKGTFLEHHHNRKTATIALNLLTGAAITTRFNWLRSQTSGLPSHIGKFTPMELDKIRELIE